MIKTSALKMAEIMGGRFTGDDSLEVSGEFVFDSRQAKKGSVFIALVGEQRDGHGLSHRRYQMERCFR